MLVHCNKLNSSLTTSQTDDNMKTTLFLKVTMMRMPLVKMSLNFSLSVKMSMKVGIMLTLKKDLIQTSDSIDGEDWVD